MANLSYSNSKMGVILLDTSSAKQPEMMKRIAQQFNPSKDIVQTALQLEDKTAFLFYLKSVVDGDKLQKTVIRPFFELNSENHYYQYIQSLPDQTELPDEQNLLIDIAKGFVMIGIQGQVILLDMRSVKSDTVQEAKTEPTIYGPQLGLSESIETSYNIIRQRYQKSSLIIDTFQLKDKAKRSVALIYDKITVNPRVLKEIKKRIDKIDFPLVQSAAELQLLINARKYSLFPTLLLTERPDRIIYNLAAGKIVILIDGSPQAIVAPVVFFDFMASTEDNYHSFWISLFTFMIRYGGLITSILLPALYVGVTSYNPDVFRTELALTVAASRIGVPYPSFIEVFFMLIFIELLTEASIRLPAAISSTATTVGGLILGTAAVEAALASNIMIIVISLVAISNFVIPLNEMAFATRSLRLIILLYTTLFGLPGLVIAFIGFILYMTNLESIGEPYFRFSWKSRPREFKADPK